MNCLEEEVNKENTSLQNDDNLSELDGPMEIDDNDSKSKQSDLWMYQTQFY